MHCWLQVGFHGRLGLSGVVEGWSRGRALQHELEGMRGQPRNKGPVRGLVLGVMDAASQEAADRHLCLLVCLLVLLVTHGVGDRVWK